MLNRNKKRQETVKVSRTCKGIDSSEQSGGDSCRLSVTMIWKKALKALWAPKAKGLAAGEGVALKALE